jgi:hypothetical protein
VLVHNIWKLYLSIIGWFKHNNYCIYLKKFLILGDVIGGAILGTIVQILNSIYIMKLFKTDNDDHKYLAVKDEVQTVESAVSRQKSSIAVSDEEINNL